MKTKEQIANDINATEDISRTIVLSAREADAFVEGMIYDNRGQAESWTVDGEYNSADDFRNTNTVDVNLVCENVPCHLVDYEDEEECSVLGCYGCEAEDEAIVAASTKMIVDDVADYREEGQNFIVVYLKVA